jgi:hypothetical protein
MFATRRDEVIPREKITIGAQRVMLTIFFSSTSLITVNALPSDVGFTQEYCTNKTLLDIVEASGRIVRRVRRGEFFADADNSMCLNGCKVINEFANLKLDCVLHLPYLPDLNPCDFWLFGMFRQKIKDRVFQTVEEIMTPVHKVWDKLTLEDLQSVFFNRIESLKCVSEHGENATQTDIKRSSESLSNDEIGDSGPFCTSDRSSPHPPVHPGYSHDLAHNDFCLFPTVKEKLEWIQVAEEDQFFESLQEMSKDLDQRELNRVFQAWMRRVQEVSEGKAMDITSDHKQFLTILILPNFIRRDWRMYLCTRRYLYVSTTLKENCYTDGNGNEHISPRDWGSSATCHTR